MIDHTVTRRDWWDYYLVSQHVSQGTVSPTHYIVAYDGGMKPDNLQKLTYKMTHMYYNWPGTIRVPAPCQVLEILSRFATLLIIILVCWMIRFAVCPQAGIFGW